MTNSTKTNCELLVFQTSLVKHLWIPRVDAIGSILNVVLTWDQDNLQHTHQFDSGFPESTLYSGSDWYVIAVAATTL